MRIQKEVWLVVAAVGFLLAWLIDRLAGPVSITVGGPIAFLKSNALLSRYPFTATAIIIRSIALFISTMLLVTSIMERKYFTKAIILFFVGALAEFYAIQQLANGFSLTSAQWTLSIAYGSLSLAVGIIWMVLMGIWSAFNEEKGVPPPPENSGSVLTP